MRGALKVLGLSTLLLWGCGSTDGNDSAGASGSGGSNAGQASGGGSGGLSLAGTAGQSNGGSAGAGTAGMLGSEVTFVDGRLSMSDRYNIAALDPGDIAREVAGSWGFDLLDETTKQRSITVSDDSWCTVSQAGALQCGGELRIRPEGSFVEAAIDNASNACAIKDNGELQCWGEYAATWTLPTGPFAGLRMRDRSGCAIRTTDSAAVCWGILGDDPIPPGQYLSVHPELIHACGVKANGDVVCWGTLLNEITDYLPQIQGVARMATSDYGGCFLDRFGKALCYGDNAIGDAVPRPNITMVAIAIGDYYACGLGLDGKLSCWGDVPTTVPAEFDSF